MMEILLTMMDVVQHEVLKLDGNEQEDQNRQVIHEQKNEEMVLDLIH